MLSPFFNRIKKDIDFRIKLFLCISFLFNVSYSIFLLIVGNVYSSKWFLVMSAYYGLLSAVRLFILIQTKTEKNLRSKILSMQTSGFFVLLINLVVSTMMFILSNNKNFVVYHEITVIALATYSFSALTVAIISSIKHLKQNNYLYSCTKLISLISASVSMVTLTNTMLSTFGKDNLSLRSIVLPHFSGVVAIFIIVCAILMICKANLDLGKIRNEKE